MTDFFVDMGIAVLLRLISTSKIPRSYVAALVKLRDKLNLAFPPELEGAAGKGFKITG